MNIRQCHCCHEFAGPAPDEEIAPEWVCYECSVPPNAEIAKIDRLEKAVIKLLDLLGVKYDFSIMEEILEWITQIEPTKEQVMFKCSQRGRDFFHHLLAASALELVTGLDKVMGWKWNKEQMEVIKRGRGN